MEAPAQIVRRDRRRRRKKIRIFAAVVAIVVIVLAIAIPCAILLPSSPTGPLQPSAILLPLYIYPTSTDTWNPLYSAIKTWPDVKFTAIINPDSGPGDSNGPNDAYVSAIRKLHGAPNIRMVGYVRTDYALRPITEVVQDVATYSGWSGIDGELAMDGIFFDEAPSEYSPEKAQFLATANQAVKNSTGIREPKITIHNPGLIPSPKFDDPRTDVTVVFEQSFDKFEDERSALDSLSGQRSSHSMMVHSVPEGTNLGKLARTMSRKAEYLFLTTADEAYYESFSSSWTKFTEIMAS